MRALGGKTSRQRTPEQTEIARFREYSMPAIYHQVVRSQRRPARTRSARQRAPVRRRLASGGGATALAFLDALLDLGDADIVIVERRVRSGGHYTVVGAGKTGMDSALWLLDQGVDPARIRWIVPRDAWLHDRAQLRSGAPHVESSLRTVLREFDAIAAAASIDQLLARLEADGLLLRLDPEVTPTMYRCAVTWQQEMAQLRRIRDIVRLGRVRRVEPSRLRLDRGAVEAAPDTLYVDCSTSALQTPPAPPVFDGNTIHLLMIQACRPLFSAALIARVERLDADADEKSALATPVPSPVQPSDGLRLRALTRANAQRWSQRAEIRDWLGSCRLDLVATLLGGTSPDDPRVRALPRERASKVQATASNLPRRLAALRPPPAAHRADDATPLALAVRTRDAARPVELT